MRRHTYLLTLAALLVVPGLAQAALTCTSVAARGDTDVNGFFFTNSFRDTVAINAGGDVLFAARPKGVKDRLYLYPGGGGSSVVAQGSLAAPGGGTFASRPFSDISINDAGDLAFRGKLVSQGQGVFVQPNAGALAAAALVTQGAPGGGVFDEFEQVSRVNAGGIVAFLAVVDGGSSGVYTHNIGTMTNAQAVLNGAAVTVPAGRFLCEILTVDLADNGDFALLADTKVNCADGGEDPVEGVYRASGGTITQVALVGDASPVGGTTYDDFVNAPFVNSAGNVAFEAKIVGTISVLGIFSWNGVATDRILAGDFESEVGGSYKKFRSFFFDNAGNVDTNAIFKGTHDNMAVIQENGTSTALVSRDDAPPFGQDYRKFGGLFGMSSNGADLAIMARIRDTVKPKTKAAILRCS